MPWARFDDRFPSNRKISLLSDRAFRLYVSAVCWCAENLTDGLIRTEELRLVAQVRNLNATARELVERKLWDQVEGGWRIHDYHDYNPTREQVIADRKKNAARQEAFRRRRNGKPVVPPSDESDSSNGGSNGVTPTRNEPPRDTNATGRRHDDDTNATGNEPLPGASPQVSEIRDAVTNAAPTRPDPTPTSGTEREEGDRSRDRAPGKLSLIPADWQPTQQDIQAAQQARTAAGRPVLTGAQLADVTRKFVRRMTSDRREATNWSARWQEWAERERPTDDQQPPLLLGLSGGATGPVWAHEMPQPRQADATPTPPSFSARMAQLEAQLRADQGRDTG